MWDPRTTMETTVNHGLADDELVVCTRNCSRSCTPHHDSQRERPSNRSPMFAWSFRPYCVHSIMSVRPFFIGDYHPQTMISIGAVSWVGGGVEPQEERDWQAVVGVMTTFDCSEQSQCREDSQCHWWLLLLLHPLGARVRQISANTTQDSPTPN